MKKFLLLVLLFLTTPAKAEPAMQSAYDFAFTSITGQPMPLAAYKGKVLLVVNTASFCGFTKQYAALEQLYDTYRNQGLVVIGVPSNDFGAQEPGTENEIKKFCEIYSVSFPLTSKTVVSGDAAHPFYQWAGAQVGFIGRPKWNFHKYLIGRNGALIDWFSSTTTPDSAKVKQAIEAALKTD